MAGQPRGLADRAWGAAAGAAGRKHRAGQRAARLGGRFALSRSGPSYKGTESLPAPALARTEAATLEAGNSTDW